MSDDATSPDVEALADLIMRVLRDPDWPECVEAAAAILDALPDLLRADTPAGDALRVRLGKCPTDCDPDCEDACHEGHDIPRRQFHGPVRCTLIREALS